MSCNSVGIDLGTTNSVVAVLEGNEPFIVPNESGSRTTPSVVAFPPDPDSPAMVGVVAKRQAVTNPDRTVTSVKRHMGSGWWKTFRDKKVTAQEVSARILAALKRDAETYLGGEVCSAVITVPAYFDDAQRQATKEAGKIAGLEVLRIINEPTAAALAYGLSKDTQDEETVLVFDLGGGTFDVSVLEIADGVFEVKSTSGDTKLGGDDWDQCVVDWLASEFQAETGVDVKSDLMAGQRLRDAAETAKMELSSVTETDINIPFLTASSAGPLHLQNRLSRSKLEQLSAGLLDRLRSPVKKALTDAGVGPSELDHVIMVGGATRMPAVAELVKSLTGKTPYKGVNPDEAVAAGAALQAGVLSGDVKDVLLLDVIPLTLGVETKGGVATPLVKRNTTIPTRQTQTFTTAESGQSMVTIHVVQGERAPAAENRSLGNFNLEGIRPAPAGVPRVEVAFDVDANGLVTVSAKDVDTGKEQSIVVTGGTSLPEDEVQRMVEEAERNADQDRRFREETEARNRAEQEKSRAAQQVPDDDEVVEAEIVE